MQDGRWQGQLTGDLGMHNGCLQGQPNQGSWQGLPTGVLGNQTGCLAGTANWGSEPTGDLGNQARPQQGRSIQDLVDQAGCCQGWPTKNQEQESTGPLTWDQEQVLAMPPTVNKKQVLAKPPARQATGL